MTGPRRVVVTGLGVLAANGIGKDLFWESLLAGRSGIGPVTRFDASDLLCRIAGEVRGFRPEDFISAADKPRHMARNTQMAVAAFSMAVSDAGLAPNDMVRLAPAGVVLATSMGGFDLLEKHMRRVAVKGVGGAVPAVIACIHTSATSEVARRLQVPTQTATLSNSCIGGLDAVAVGATMIESGQCDIVIAGASDAAVERSMMVALDSVGMLSRSNRDPGRASRPFDLFRDRGVLAEGAAVVILESEDVARARGGTPYASIGAHATSMDEVGAEDASGLAASMRQALASEGLITDDIDCILAHGPSDRDLDRVETRCIRAVLGRHADRVPAPSIKGVTGNALSVGGMMQLVTACMMFRHGRIPPTANYEHRDPQCDLDYVAGSARVAAPESILINAHGMGRINSSLIVRRAKET